MCGFFSVSLTRSLWNITLLKSSLDCLMIMILYLALFMFPSWTLWNFGVLTHLGKEGCIWFFFAFSLTPPFNRFVFSPNYPRVLSTKPMFLLLSFGLHEVGKDPHPLPGWWPWDWGLFSHLAETLTSGIWQRPPCKTSSFLPCLLLPGGFWLLLLRDGHYVCEPSFIWPNSPLVFSLSLVYVWCTGTDSVYLAVFMGNGPLSFKRRLGGTK